MAVIRAKFKVKSVEKHSKEYLSIFAVPISADGEHQTLWKGKPLKPSNLELLINKKEAFSFFCVDKEFYIRLEEC